MGYNSDNSSKSISEKAFTLSKAFTKSFPAKLVGLIVLSVPSPPNTLANVLIPKIVLNNLRFSLSLPYLPIDNLALCEP